MIKVSALYPHTDSGKFDLNYYVETHIPMVQKKLGTALKSAEITKGLGGATPGSPPPFTVMAHMYFDSLDTFQAAFGPHAEAIMADVPNFTNLQPTIQIGEVLG